MIIYEIAIWKFLFINHRRGIGYVNIYCSTVFTCNIAFKSNVSNISSGVNPSKCSTIDQCYVIFKIAIVNQGSKCKIKINGSSALCCIIVSEVRIWNSSVCRVSYISAPPFFARFPLKVQFAIVVLDDSTDTAPPYSLAILFLKVEFAIVTYLALT